MEAGDRGCHLDDEPTFDPGWGADYLNRKDYDAMVDSSGDLFPQGITMNFTDAAADGDRVFLEANGHGPLADGRIYANHYVFTFRFRGELISEIVEYLDTAYAQKLLAFTIEAPAGS